MNLYDIHPDPENAPYRDWAFERVPELVWGRCSGRSEELKKREAVLARSAKYSYFYAAFVLGGAFPAGEPVIAGDAKYAYWYARYILELRRCDAKTWPARPSLWQRLKYWLGPLLDSE